MQRYNKKRKEWPEIDSAITEDKQKRERKRRWVKCFPDGAHIVTLGGSNQLNTSSSLSAALHTQIESAPDRRQTHTLTLSHPHSKYRNTVSTPKYLCHHSSTSDSGDNCDLNWGLFNYMYTMHKAHYCIVGADAKWWILISVIYVVGVLTTLTLACFASNNMVLFISSAVLQMHRSVCSVCALGIKTSFLQHMWLSCSLWHREERMRRYQTVQCFSC